jgi:hypothetical protein
METAGASETSVNFYQTTRRYYPEDSHLHFAFHQHFDYPLGFLARNFSDRVVFYSVLCFNEVFS